MNKNIKKSVLLILAVIVCLCMVRLGFWQLERAEQKREILSQSIKASELPVVDLAGVAGDFESDAAELSFRQVFAKGRYLANQSILIDNQVLNSRVGYALLTPFQLSDSQLIIMVARGWLPVGDSRQSLPEFATSHGEQSVQGRLNALPAKPPLWDDDYPVSAGQVWQFLSVQEYRVQTGLEVMPMVLELAPQTGTESDKETIGDSAVGDSLPVVSWRGIENEWVYKHQAYALQWFSMAVVFFIACLIVLVGSMRKTDNN